MTDTDYRAQHERMKAKARPDTMPHVIVGANLELVADNAIEVLRQRGGIYVRGRTLVEIVRDRANPDWLTRPEGAPVIVPIASARLREILSSAARWHHQDDDKLIAPPLDIVATVIARGTWDLPAIEGVTDAPVLRADGSVLATPGYDAATRLYYEPGTNYPAIPETREAAEVALTTLCELFCDFPFVAGGDLAATLALILSLVGRAAIAGEVPMFVATAPTPGSGKGKLVDVCSIIATGRKAPKMPPAGDNAEMAKRILALALESPPLVSIDNVEGALGSPALAMALTSGSITDRVLGETRSATASLRFVWCATGNNPEYKGDLGRRVVPITLDPKCEHPEDRHGFRYPDLEAHILSHRPRLVVAALTILRAYIAAGKPAHGLPAKGSFETWDRLVRGAIIWLAGPENDPLAGVVSIREDGDIDLDNLRALLTSWHRYFGDREVAVAELIEQAAKSGAVDPKRTALADALKRYGDRGELPDATALGRVMRGKNGRIVSGYRIVKGDKSNGVTRWKVVATT
jgi:hypothetical protein